MINVEDLKKGFILDPQGNRLLPITHINLVIGHEGESLSNTLNRITETINVLQESGGILTVNTNQEMQDLDTTNIRNGALCYVSDEDKYYSYSINSGWRPALSTSTGSDGDNEEESSDIYVHIWVGPEPPEDNRMLWLDTNTDGVLEGEQDLDLLNNLKQLIKEMQTSMDVLNKRVNELEEMLENGIIVAPDDPDNYGILLEDGSSILLENGSELLLEVQGSSSSILLENGSSILLEDGTELLLEVQGSSSNPQPEENALLFENNSKILLEDNSTLLLE